MPWFHGFFNRRQKDAELDEEIAVHLAMEIHRRTEAGEAPELAATNATRDFGNVTRVKEDTRETWTWTPIESALREQRHVVRHLMRNPGFSIVAVAVLAIGIGITTAMFSIVHSIVLSPLPFPDSHRLFTVVNVPPPTAQSDRLWQVNAKHVFEWRTHCQSCEDVAMAESIGFTLTGTGEAERVSGFRVSYNFFRTLGIRPTIGRDFRPDEELPGGFHEVLLTDALWRSHFGTDPTIVGRSAQLNGESFLVVGILPATLQLPVGDQWGPSGVAQGATPPLIFRPLGMDISKARGAGMNNYVAIVRAKPGVGAARISAEFDALIGEYIKEFGIQLKTVVLPLQDAVTQGARTGLWLLLAAGISLWVIVCVNVANLVLVRTVGRDREAGIRLALGSSRAQLFRLVLSEVSWLVLASALAGIILTMAVLRLFVSAAPANVPRLADIRLDAGTLLFAIATAAASTFVCGIVPAWRLASHNIQTALRTGSLTTTAATGKVRFREALVLGEVALSTVLLIVGGLLVVSFIRVLQVPKGFDAEHVMTQDVSLGLATFRDPDRIHYVDEAIARLSALDGVTAVGVTNQPPLRGETWLCELRDPGAQTRQVGLANFRFVSAGLWRALGIPLKRGRFFEPADRDRPVAIVDERIAQTLWPSRDPIGQHVGACGPDGLEVIGVVGNVRAEVERDAPNTIYQPYWTNATSRPSFVVRTSAEPHDTGIKIRTVLRSIEPGVAVLAPQTMEAVLSEVTATRRFYMNVVVAFGIAALLLAALGIYGAVSFTVARRAPEIGIRMALGAQPATLIAMVMQQGLAPVIRGLVVGLAASLVAGPSIGSQLYGVGPTDAMTMSIVSIVLLLVAVCACAMPVRRALRISPLIAVRYE